MCNAQDLNTCGARNSFETFLCNQFLPKQKYSISSVGLTGGMVLYIYFYN